MLNRKLAVPAAAFISLSGLFGFAHGAGAAPSRVRAAAYSGTIAITDYQFPDSLALGGAYSNGVADVELSGAMIDSPLGFDQKGNFYADLATVIPSTANGGIKVVGGNEVVTVHLKPNMKWSDGTTITTNDYVLSLLLDFAPEFNSTFGVDRINTVTFSGNAMVITFKGLYAPALSYGIPSPEPLEFFEKKYGITLDPSLTASYNAATVQAYFASAAYKGSPLQKFVEQWVNDAYNSPKDVFNGAYKLAEWTQDQRITLVPNTYYTALPADPNHPRPAKIQFVVISENAPTLVQDLAAASTYATIDKAEDFFPSDVPALSRSKYQIIVPQSLEFEHLELNTTNPALAKVQVRQALYFGLDKTRYLEAMFPGLSAAQYNNLYLTSPLPSVSPWSNNTSLPRNAYNPSKAKALLAAAGYSHGLTLNFVTTAASARIRSAQLLQRLWSEIGVTTKIRFVAPFGSNGLFSSFVDGGILYHGAQKAFDIAEFAFATSPDPDQTIANVEPQYIPNATHPTGGNYASINDPLITKDMNEAELTLDNAKRHQLYDSFQNQMVQQAYWIMLFNRPNVIAFKGTIGNFKPNVTQAGNEWNAWQWWYDPTGSQKALLS